MPFIVIAIGVIIAIIVLGLLILPSFIDEQQIIALAQEQVRKSTGGELRVDGETRITLLPSLSIALNSTTIDLPGQPERSGRTLASVGSLEIGLSPVALLMGKTEVGEVVLTNTNLQLFEVDGTLTTQLALAELRADDLNIANNPMRLRAALQLADLAGGEPISIALTGMIRVPEALDRIELDNLTTDISGLLSQDIKTALTGVVELTPLKATLDLVANLPGGDIDGNLLYASEQSPQIDLNFHASLLDLDKLAPPSTSSASDAAGGGAIDTSASQDSGVKPPPVPVPVGPLRNLDLRLTVTADALISNAQTISDAQLLLRVVDGISDLQYLRGVLHQGQLDTAMTIDVRQPTTKITLKGGLNGVNIDSLTASLGLANTAAGRVDMNWDVETKGTTSEDLQLGLDGTMTLEGSNVELIPVSAQAKMCAAIATVNQQALTQTMPTTTKISTLGAKVNFGDKQARVSTLKLATPGVIMSGSGAASLRDLNFQLGVKASISEELEALDNACRIEQRYMAIDWPVKCAGNLTGDASKWCAVDLESIVKQLLANEAKSKLQKQADKLGEKASNALKKLFGG